VVEGGGLRQGLASEAFGVEEGATLLLGFGDMSLACLHDTALSAAHDDASVGHQHLMWPPPNAQNLMCARAWHDVC
jgi:hypothetical protein